MSLLTRSLIFVLIFLYRGPGLLSSFPEVVFVELMELATKSVAFSFNNVMYRQVDGISMGSPLEPTLANIFVGFLEQLLFNKCPRPIFYMRYVDDIFSCFATHDEAMSFFKLLNDLHPSISFTMKVKKTTPFLSWMF